ncbi:filamentous hemagglutinin N-terminal domain-containing protein [Trinickia sp. NRRL B-1857]|uniref:two-partner secretion domain-containing protein n=1 Tax=Trinickia sp. NRRL B-1857 TaxID=3162879 RepID=UPI003D2D8287
MLQAARKERSRRAQPALAPLFVTLSLAVPGFAQAAGPLPIGGQFVAGSGSINGNATSLTVNQTSTRGVIDWNSFSIGSGNQVNINNGNGATLNRVTGGALSSILGTLSSTGSVYLINPQGIVIGRSGVVSTGGRFVASTLDVNNDAFMNGDALTFSNAPGTLSGAVVNLGKISSSGGDVFLIASNEVDNVGTISTPNGTTELAAGDHVLLQDSAASRQVFVESGSGGKVVNRGDIEAAQISLQAADGNIYALAGNHSVLRATGTSTRSGHVWLVADTGRVWMDGTVEAHNADGSGGIVDTVADRLRIAGGPTVKASQWNITTPSFTIDGLAAPVFQSNLDRGTSINLQTTGTNGTSGELDVAASIHWVGAASLTLGAYHSLTIEAAAYLKNCGAGNLTLRADAQGLDNGGSVTNYGTIDWSTSRGIVSAFYDMNGSYTPGKLVANKTWTAPTYSGLVTQITGYKLVNSLADLEKVNTDLAGNYALGKDIDASATSNGSYVQLGTTSSAFTGQFDGEGHTINSLTLQGTDASLGMFALLGKSAVVRDLNVNGSVSMQQDDFNQAAGVEGILAAENDGTIVHVNTSGSVNDQFGMSNVVTAGGLVGINRGNIEYSSSAANVTSGTVGGLVGENDGVIDRSFASGQVNAAGGRNTTGSSGGLVSTNNGTISQSYATGAVTAGCDEFSCGAAGGLVNSNSGTITQSYETGTVTSGCTGGPFGGCGNAGGLVASNSGTIRQSFETGAVSGPFGGIFTLASSNAGTIGGDVYWNADANQFIPGVGSGTPVPASNGLTTAQLSNAASFAGYDFGQNGVWAIPANGSHPVLQWQLAPGNGG